MPGREISAMATALAMTLAFAISGIFQWQRPVIFAKTTLATTGVTTAAWVIVNSVDARRAGLRLAPFLPESAAARDRMAAASALASGVYRKPRLGPELVGMDARLCLLYADYLRWQDLLRSDGFRGICCWDGRPLRGLLYRDIVQRVSEYFIGRGIDKQGAVIAESRDFRDPARRTR